MHILIVEPDRLIAGFLEAGLQASGHRVEVAKSDAEVKAVLAVHRFDVALADAGRDPAKTGRLAALLGGPNRTTPIVVLTTPDALDRERDISRLDRCLAKPFRFDDLLSCIESLSGSSGVDAEGCRP